MPRPRQRRQSLRRTLRLENGSPRSAASRCWALPFFLAERAVALDGGTTAASGSGSIRFNRQLLRRQRHPSDDPCPAAAGIVWSVGRGSTTASDSKSSDSDRLDDDSDWTIIVAITAPRFETLKPRASVASESPSESYTRVAVRDAA